MICVLSCDWIWNDAISCRMFLSRAWGIGLRQGNSRDVWQPEDQNDFVTPMETYSCEFLKHGGRGCVSPWSRIIVHCRIFGTMSTWPPNIESSPVHAKYFRSNKIRRLIIKFSNLWSRRASRMERGRISWILAWLRLPASKNCNSIIHGEVVQPCDQVGPKSRTQFLPLPSGGAS
jgi:hypothetical protein